ncbi:Cell adhesion molecule [Fasciola hepatica]|uniref:Cell adhesion molecule n=1 Tax=Fasciola hepatica TaxID=6192 RepID=A0A4E0S498_FASHE|nr:Cell adhesion molecule [Fasciola hepatica]
MCSWLCVSRFRSREVCNASASGLVPTSFVALSFSVYQFLFAQLLVLLILPSLCVDICVLSAHSYPFKTNDLIPQGENQNKSNSPVHGSSDQRWPVPWVILNGLVPSQHPALHRPGTRLRRITRNLPFHTPPRITPDLPPLVRFFDRTGLQIQCLAAGNPRPRIRWFSLPTNGRTARADHLVGAAHSDKLSLRSAATSLSADEPERSRTDEQDAVVVNVSNGEAEEEEEEEEKGEDELVSELGYNNYVKEAPQADQAEPVEVPSESDTEEPVGLFDQSKSTNQVIVGDGWLNFTAARSSTMRMVFFCQAENYLGRARSRKMVVHQVPMPDKNLRIVYNTFPIKPNQKAVITCQPEQGIFNRFLKVNFWEVYLNGTLINTIDRSFGRFSMINITKHPELHIRAVTETELAGLEVRCVLQSIVDESVKVERPERGRLQRLQLGFSYNELRSIGNEISVLRGSTIELPWAVEGEVRVRVDWFYLNDASRNRQTIALDSSSSSVSGPGNTGSGSGSLISGQKSNELSSELLRQSSGVNNRVLPWGTKYELVDGAFGNLRLVNLSVQDSGHYIAESAHGARSLQVKYSVRVRAPLGVKITPQLRTVDWGSRVELSCEVTGHPRQLVYWLHNAHLVPRRHHVRTVAPATSSSDSADHAAGRFSTDSLTERLIIEAFTLEDVGVYQCIAENGHSAERLGLSAMDSLVYHTRVTSGPPISERKTSSSSTTGGPDGENGFFSFDDRASSSASSHSAGTSATTSTTTSTGEGVGDLVDNAQATALLTMGKMRPSLTWQHPAVETGAIAAQVLLSIRTGVTDVMLECRFAANPTPNITWYRDDEPVPQDNLGVITPHVLSDNQTAYTTVTRLTLNIRKIPDLNDLWAFGGEYRAIAVNDYGQADCRSYVLLETPLRLRKPEMAKPAIAGRAYTIKCYFIGSGIPSLQWHRIKAGDVQRIPVDHRHQLLEDGRALRITEVMQEEDEADYRCTATLGEMIANMTVRLKVSHAPRLYDLPQTRQVKNSRDMLSYSCALQNMADKPWYAWWEFQREGSTSVIRLPPPGYKRYEGFYISYVAEGGNETKTYTIPNTLFTKVPDFAHSEANSAVHVTVKQLRKELHHGNLTCVVANEVGWDRQSIRVTFVPELEFEIRPPNNKDVTLGQTISIDCAAKPSDLQPVVEWKYLQKTTGSYVSVSDLSEATNGRIAQLQNGTLLLSYVDDSDPREFLCFLKPGRISTAAQRSSAVNLEVHVPARIEPIENLEKVRGSRFNLTCSVHGDPDDLRAAWYYRLSQNSKWHLIDKPCVVPLALLDDNRSVLREDGTMDPRLFDETARFTESSSIRSDLSVTSTISSLTDCQSYATEGLESGILFRQVSFFKPNKRGLDRQLQFFSVKEVHMGDYLCRASNMYNRNADDERVEVEAFARLTVISVPDPVSFVQNSSRTTATTVSFAWLPPTRDGNKPVRKYRIRYSHSDEAHSTQQSNVTELDVNASLRRIELKNLRPYTKYHITVAAINDVGPSVENALALTTQEAKPDGPVRRLVANGTASDTIVVAWDNPAPEHLNGNVDRYWVCRQRVNDSLTVSELARLPWPDEASEEQMSSSGINARGRYGPVHCAKVIRQRDYEVTGLPKFTAYAFRVIALNSKGPSPPAFIQARTLEDLPQAPPADVACASQQHSITVSWNPPHPNTINGILTEYHVSYFAANAYGDETNSVKQAVKGQTTVTLAGLLAYTNYSVQVAVSNRKGRGPSSPRLICRTKEAPPTAPEHIKANPLNGSCVMVSWSHPRKPQGHTRSYCLEAIPLVETAQNGIVNLYPYPTPYPDRGKGPCVRPDFSRPYNYYSYCGLVEQRPYNISVRATNQFDGHKAWAGPVRPMSSPPLGIISIGRKLLVQNKIRVIMDCLVIGGYQPQWNYPHDNIADLQVFENGTLIIESANLMHSGKYECFVGLDKIVYDLTVQEIVEEPPRKPIWHKFTPSLRGIQAEWLSPGSTRIDSPILWFHLNWTNLYTGLSQCIRLPPDQRTYYLSNLTCATTVRFQLCAENKVGNSSLTDVTSWTTLGSAPLAANAAQLIPNPLRQQTTVSFNLSSFLPGNGCPPLFYRLLIAPSQDGHFGLKEPLINRTLTRADLITLDGLSRCCFNVTQLSSGAHYHYKVVATNPAGSVSVQGQFWTLTVFGREPVLRQTHQIGQSGLLQQPTVIVPITALFAIILIVLIAVPFFCRHRRLEESFRPSKEPTTQCQNDLRPGDSQPHHLHHHQQQQQQQQQAHRSRGHPHQLHQAQQHQHLLAGHHAQHAYNPYHPNRAVRDGLPPIPNQSDSQASTVVMSNRRKHGRGWFAGTRARLYDRGRSGSSTVPDPSDHVANRAPVEDDQLSTNSVDSEGNINPYATYAASGFPERPDGTGPAAAPGTSAIGAKSHVMVSLADTVSGVSSRAAVGPYARDTVDALMGTSWNTVFKRSGIGQMHPGPESLVGHPVTTAHHYHYPNLESGPMGNSTVGRPRPRLFRCGSGSRLGPSPTFMDPRLLPPATAALLDPMFAPYDNSTLSGEQDLDLEDELARVSGLGPIPPAMRRRVNSFESLHRLPGGLSQTYHRGFGAGIPGHSLIPGGLIMPGANMLPAGGVGPSSVSFYDPGVGLKHPDPMVAYRGSVLSSTTASSNQDELMQAYEYGRRNQPRGIAQSVTQPGVLPLGTLEPRLRPVNRTESMDRTPTVVHHPGLMTQVSAPAAGIAVAGTDIADISGAGGGGSGESSDVTDSGIRQFTQQPPQPDEDRHATCEVPLMYDGGTGPNAVAGPAGFRARTTGLGRNRADGRHGFPSQIGGVDWSSEMTDTYASVDYNGTPYGPMSSVAGAGLHRNALSKGGRGLYGAAGNSGLMPVSTRARQPLPALPSTTSIISYPDPSAYGTRYGPAQPGSYYPSIAGRPTAFNPTRSTEQMRCRGQPPGPVDQRDLSAGSNPSGTTGRIQTSLLDDSDSYPSEVRTLMPRTITGAPLSGRTNRPRGPPVGSEHPSAVSGSTIPNQTGAPCPDSGTEENVYTSEFVLV